MKKIKCMGSAGFAGVCGKNAVAAVNIPFLTVQGCPMCQECLNALINRPIGEDATAMPLYDQLGRVSIGARAALEKYIEEKKSLECKN